MNKLLLSIAAFGLIAADYPQPVNNQPVIDAANVIDDAQEADLNRQLIDFQNAHGTVLVVGTTPSLGNKDIERYSLEWARELGVGQAGSNNGVVLVFAPNERQARIETGIGMGEMLTDSESGRILDYEVIPVLKNGGSIGDAAQEGVTAILREITPETAEQRVMRLREEAYQRQQRQEAVSGFLNFLLIVGLIALVVSPFAIWYYRKRRAIRLAEEAAAAELREKRYREAQEAARREAERRAREREEMLAKMSPRERAQFLAREEQKRRQAAERERQRREEERKEEARRAPERRRRQRDDDDDYGGRGGGGGYSSGSSSSSSSSPSFGGFGGGSFGGGGASRGW